ncbi:hypothetical protein GCM10022279_32740 [Comamonas faecalis]|uniref:Uncharacterized protein n=1 Tax=Comamonas faecalis TaxID=1387849 RepID=A0ABP7S3S5_9BURK
MLAVELDLGLGVDGAQQAGDQGRVGFVGGGVKLQDVHENLVGAETGGRMGFGSRQFTQPPRLMGEWPQRAGGFRGGGGGSAAARHEQWTAVFVYL